MLICELGKRGVLKIKQLDFNKVGFKVLKNFIFLCFIPEFFKRQLSYFIPGFQITVDILIYILSLLKARNIAENLLMFILPMSQ